MWKRSQWNPLGSCSPEDSDGGSRKQVVAFQPLVSVKSSFKIIKQLYYTVYLFVHWLKKHAKSVKLIVNTTTVATKQLQH